MQKQRSDQESAEVAAAKAAQEAADVELSLPVPFEKPVRSYPHKHLGICMSSSYPHLCVCIRSDDRIPFAKVEGNLIACFSFYDPHVLHIPVRVISLVLSSSSSIFKSQQNRVRIITLGD